MNSKGTADSLHITIHTSVGDLLSQYSAGLTAASLGYAGQWTDTMSTNSLVETLPVGLESEPTADFEDVTMRHAQPMRVPVSMRIADSHIRITTVSLYQCDYIHSSHARNRPRPSPYPICYRVKLPRLFPSVTSTTSTTCRPAMTPTSS